MEVPRALPVGLHFDADRTIFTRIPKSARMPIISVRLVIIHPISFPSVGAPFSKSRISLKSDVDRGYRNRLNLPYQFRRLKQPC
jgi:hypothetical protein